jgi:hypothetical protein
MTKDHSKTDHKSKTEQFRGPFRGLFRRKEKGGNHEAGPATQRAASTAAPAATRNDASAVEAAQSTENHSELAVQSSDGDADPPKTATEAEKRLKKAAKELQKLIPADIAQSEDLEIKTIKGCADINSLADKVGSAVVKVMEHRSMEIEKQPAVQKLLKSWVKNVLPFVHQGLSIAKVVPRCPFIRRSAEN